MVYHDAVSSATHLFMAAWAVLATLILLKITKYHGIGRRAVGIYGLTMILLYSASGLFHGLIWLKIGPEALHRPEAVEAYWFFQKFDKSCIFLLIAGSYIPIVVYTVVGWWRIGILALMNLIGLAGVLSLWLLPTMNHVWLVAFYSGMGLIGLVGFRQIGQGVHWRGLHWVAIFAGLYLLGAAAEVAGWPTIVPGWVWAARGAARLRHGRDVGTLHLSSGLRDCPSAAHATPMAQGWLRRRVADAASAIADSSLRNHHAPNVADFTLGPQWLR